MVVLPTAAWHCCSVLQIGEMRLLVEGVLLLHTDVVAIMLAMLVNAV